MLHLCLKAVSLAFNFAVESGRRSQAIEDSPGYWAYSVVNVATQDLECIIDEFHSEKVSPSGARGCQEVDLGIDMVPVHSAA